MGLHIIQLEDHCVIDFACQELAAASERAGARWPIISERAEGTAVIVGTWAALKEYDQPVKGKTSDRFFIREEEGRIYISGENERATLYAVYEFCKQYWGENWIYPSVLTAASTDNGDIINQTYEPVFSRRGFVFETINEPEYIAAMVDWMAKNRINEVFFTFTLWDALKEVIAPEIRKRGLQVTLGGHSMKFFLNRESITKQLTAQHPYTAKRQLDYEDNRWQQTVCQEIAEYCKDVPNLTRISLWPEDVAVEPESGENRFLKQYVRFSELLKATMSKNGFDVEVEHIAYNAGLAWNMLERNQMEASKEVDTLYAYWGRDYRQSPEKCNQRAFLSLKDWLNNTKKQGRELTIFEYYSDQFMLTPLFPLLSERIMADIQEYKQMGVDGMLNLVVPVRTIEYHPWHWIHHFNSYVFSRACWSEPLEIILEDYFSYYAEGDREWVRKTFEQIEQVLPAITAWNIPLFPARIVDPEKAKTSKEQTEQALLLLGQINESMEKMLEHSPLSHTNPAYVYVKHLADYSKELKAFWGEKRF